MTRAKDGAMWFGVGDGVGGIGKFSIFNLLVFTVRIPVVYEQDRDH